MSLGSLVIELQANVARLESDMGRATQIAENKLKVIDLAAARTAKNIENMAQAGSAVRRSNGIEEVARGMERVTHTTTAARRELLVLAHELSQGNFKRFGGSLMVLGEQMDWMGKIMSPVGLAIGGVVAAIGILGYGFVKGALESAHFNQSLLLTGNYAGLTEGRFNALAKATAQSADVTIGNAREVAQGLVSSGRFSGAALESITRAALKLEETSGMTSEEVVKDMTRMSDGVLKWALEANKQYHFVDGALYDHIKALEEQGRKEEAEMVASKALYAHLGGDAVKNVGALERAWLNLKEALSAAKDELLAIGRATTVEDQIGSLQAQAARIRGAQAGAAGSVNADLYSSQLAAVNSKIGALTASQRNQQNNADLTATRKQHDDQVVEAKQFWDRFTEAHHTGAEEMRKQLDEVARKGALAGASPADIAAAQDKIRKEFEPHGAGAVQRADFNSTLKPLEDQVSMETKILGQRETMLTKYYKNSQLSMDNYYSGQEYAISEATKKITDLYDQQISAAERYASSAKDAAARVNAATQAQQLRDKRDQVVSELGSKSDLLGESRRHDADAYAESVAHINAELNTMRGNLAAGAGQAFDRANHALSQRATAEGDTATIGGIAALRDITIEQAQLNELKARAQTIEDRLSNTQQRIALQTQTGQKSEIEGMVELGDKRAVAVQQLSAIADQMQRIAEESGLPAMVSQADAFRLKVDELSASTNIVGKTLNDIFANSFAGALEKSINGTKSLKQNFLDMANSIEQAISRIVATDLANRLFGAAGAGDTSNGGGGLIGQLLGMAVGFIGGGGATGSEAIGASSSSTPDDLISGYRATGGPVGAGNMYEVGENGPELLTMANRTFLMMGDTPGKVTPMSGGAGSGGRSNVFNMNIAVPSGTTRQSAQQQAAEIMRHANIALARNS